MTTLVSSAPRVEESLCAITFSESDVVKVINNLNDQSSPGPDQLPVCILKNCRHTLAPYLSDLMNTSFETGHLPQNWKHAIVTPIFKKGDKTKPENFRQISLTSIVVKLMEKIICTKLTQFLNRNCVISAKQHGFVEKRSTVTNLLECVHAWSSEVDNKIPVDIVYLDFERAFDKVPHQRLLMKLNHYGIRGKLHAWFNNYLTRRTYQVRIGNSLSQIKCVSSGVPQGAVAAPDLFGIFITDLIELINCQSAFFADDGKKIANPLVKAGQLQEDLDRIQRWTNDWIIKLNISKCSVLHLGKNNPQTTYNLNGVAIASVNQQKDLGIIITTDLKWEQHISTIVKKANSFLYVIRKSFQTMTVEVFIKIYKTYVRPLLEYGYQIWSPYFKKDIDLLESVQRKATKTPYALRRKTYEERLQILGLTSLEERRLRGDLIETFKILNGYYNLPDIQDIYSLTDYTRDSRRHNTLLRPAPSHTNTAHHILSNRVVYNWNRLPEDVVSSQSLNAFKNNLDKWIKLRKIVLTDNLKQ